MAESVNIQCPAGDEVITAIDAKQRLFVCIA